MACGKCGGYYECHCDLLEMQEQLRVTQMEVELLQFRLAARQDKGSHRTQQPTNKGSHLETLNANHL